MSDEQQAREAALIAIADVINRCESHLKWVPPQIKGRPELVLLQQAVVMLRAMREGLLEANREWRTLTAELEAERAKLAAATRESESLRGELERANQRIAAEIYPPYLGPPKPGKSSPGPQKSPASVARIEAQAAQVRQELAESPAQPGVRCFALAGVMHIVSRFTVRAFNCKAKRYAQSHATVCDLIAEGWREITPAEALDLIPDDWPEGKAELRRLIGEAT